jgi:hypothetical protein
MAETLTLVHISQKGIVKNILSLNYNHQTTMKEYLNNVLVKNVHPEYSVNFNMKNFERDQTFMFECTEQNACGFVSMDELRRAFSIAVSERTGANNMGYGIYSPITINKDKEAIGLFIQDNENGRFYSVVHFNATHTLISTKQGPLEEIEEYDIPQLLDGVRGGTKFIWFTSPDTNDINEEPRMLSIVEIIRRVKRNYRVSQSHPIMDDEDILSDIKDLGKYYHYYLDNDVSISYDGDLIEPINILEGDGLNPQEKTFTISVVPSTKEYRIMDNESNQCKFNKSGNPFGKHAQRAYHMDVQSATVKIVDIDKPLEGTSKKTRMIDRKIWVKIDETYLFGEVFPLNNWPNLRVVIELTNESDNNFNEFISPDANKSNSKINPQIKDRIVCLVKSLTNGEFGRSNQVKISDKMKHEAWEYHIGDTLCGTCMKDDCQEDMGVWKYAAVLCGDEVNVESLMCVCKSCGKH